MHIITALLIGLVFGLGIMISGMANPAKVLNFFDIAGTWDPSLAFVMGGALITTFIGYRVVLARKAPLLAPKFDLPTRRDIDASLVAGSAIFGAGWGLAGFCPGGALPALGTGRFEVLVFVAALIVGVLARRALRSMMGETNANSSAPGAAR
ncbi:MAG: DUF6691 family protein [Hyphomicrobiaceae bacterium]